MAEVQNKITYADFYTQAASDATTIENAVSILHQIYEYMAQLTSITVTWYQNSETATDLNTATITIRKTGCESWYELSVTTVGVTGGSCKITLNLICKSGTSKNLWNSTATAANWKSYGERFIYLSTADVFVFNLYMIKDSDPTTAFSTDTFGMFAQLENQTNIYHSTTSTFYKDDGTYKSMHSNIAHSGDVNKIVLANLYIGGSQIKGLCMLRTADECLVNNTAYFQLDGYGKYYSLYCTTSTHYSIGVKLGD